MVFYVMCECGSYLCTSVIHAGSTVECVDCGKSVRVPSSNRLHDSEGKPLWTPLQLTAMACANASEPFTSLCHVCNDFEATMQRDGRIRFQASKHFVSPESLIDLPGVSLSKAPFSSRIGELEFPLCFCDDCARKFTRDWKVHSAKSFADKALMAIGVTLCLIVMVVLAVILPILTVPVAIGLVGKLLADQKKIKADQFLKDHLTEIKWIGDAVRSDASMQIHVGPEKSI